MVYLQITLQIAMSNRPQAAGVYTNFRQPFLSQMPGARSKELLLRGEDVQVLHGFDTRKQAEAYLESHLFNNDVVVGLKPLLDATPEVRIYDVA